MTQPQGDDRRIPFAKRLKLAALAALASRFAGIGAQVIAVPLAIELVGRERYGAFLVLSSLLGWLALSNLGLANGLTSPLATSLAKGDSAAARRLVGSTLAILVLVGAVLVVGSLFAIRLGDWGTWLGVGTSVPSDELIDTVRAGIVIAIFGIVASIGDRILYAQQRAHVPHVLGLCSSVVVVVWLFALERGVSLTALVTCMLLPRVLAQCVSVVVALAPANMRFGPGDVSWQHGKRVLRSGIGFLVVQLAAIAMWQTDNVIVAQLFGASNVAAYATTFRLGTICTMLMTAALTGIWPAVAGAVAQGEQGRVRQWLRRAIVLFVSLGALAGITIVVVGDDVLRVWTSGEIAPPSGMLWAVAAHLPLFAWCLVISQFLNGFGRVRGQALYGAGAAVMNIALSLTLGSQFGPVGVCWATVASSILPAILAARELRQTLDEQVGDHTSKS